MSNYYAAVFGAGICGTAIAQELTQRGKNVLLVDPYVSESAPGAPAALVNPATGRRAKLGWRGKQCYDALCSGIKKLVEATGRNDLISDSGVVRPAISEKLTKSFKRSLDKYDWPEGWIRWMAREEMEAFNGELAPHSGGLYVASGFTVYVDRYLNTYRRFLRRQGVDCRYEQADYRPLPDGDGFDIRFEGEKMKAERVIVAAGYRCPEFEEWSDIEVEGVKGQIICYEAEEDLPWRHAISARGYCMRRGDRQLVVGATYEHDFDDLDTTREARDTIREKLKLMLPDIADSVHWKDQLSGVRVTTQNRLPVIGRHPDRPNLLIYTGMNSKGLLFSHYVAGLLADHLLAGDPIPAEIDVKRWE